MPLNFEDTRLPIMGHYGFHSPGTAETDARLMLFDRHFCVVEKNGNYGWLAPVEHAKKLCREDNGMHLIWEHKK